jgi:hypothetical protein
MADHAACSPSSAAMWMNCAASITKSAGLTRPSSRYAREGTAAHRIAEMIIAGNIFPPGKITVEGEQFIVGIPMLRALNPYITFVQNLQAQTPDVRVEQRVRIGRGGLVWGTADCVARLDDTMIIADLKYGTGVPVAPDSAQLKIYALAAMDTLWPNVSFQTVCLTIVQPRLDPAPKPHAMSAGELIDWGDAELQPAIKRINKGDETENPGAYCRWCVRKTVCAAHKAVKVGVAGDAFNDGVDTLNT